MIRLTHLRAENFKQLRDVDIKFPARFRALIEGPNEAGKSTLFEAIYFALYSRGLSMSGGGGGQLSSLIAHGSQSATIQLGIQANDAHLNITRTLHRTRTIKPEVEVTTPEGKEIVQGVHNVNREILAYINQLDGNTLLSSCFVQQKRLGHIEDMSPEKRQELLLKLLDMDRLTRLKSCFKWHAQDSHILQSAQEKFRLCQIAHELIEAQANMDEIERRLTMAEIHAALEQFEAESKVAEVARCNVARHEIESNRLAAEITRVEALDEMINLLSQILRARETVAAREDARQRIFDELERIAKLEREELPSIQSDIDLVDELIGRIEKIALMEEERDKMIARAERLRSVVVLAESLTTPKKELELLAAALEASRSVQNTLETATHIEKLRAAIAELEQCASNASERRLRLVQLNEQSDRLQEMQQEFVELENERSAAREELSTLEEQEHRVQQAQAIRAWAAARRDADRRSQIGQIITDLISKAEAARARQAEAIKHERRAQSLAIAVIAMIVAGAVAAGLGLFAITGLFKLSAIALGLALMAVGAWMLVSARRRRNEAALERQMAERDATQLERQARDEEVRRDAMANQSPANIAEARSRLVAMGLSEPASAQEAERLAGELSDGIDKDLSTRLEGQLQVVEQLNRTCQTQQEKLRLEEHDLDRELRRVDLQQADEINAAIRAAERAQAEAQEQRDKILSEIELLRSSLPSQWNTKGLKIELQAREQVCQEVEIELARFQESVRVEQEQILESLRDEGAQSIDTARGLMKQLAGELAEMRKRAGANTGEASHLAELLPDELSSGELHEWLKRASAAKAQIENKIVELRTRINAEEQRVSAGLEADGLVDVEAANRVITQLEKDAQRAAAQIAADWKADEQLLQRWGILSQTDEAKIAAVSIRSPLDLQMKYAHAEIAKRPAHEKELENVTAEMQSQLNRIESWHNELAIAARNAGCNLELASCDFNYEIESELFQQAKPQRDIYNLNKLKQDYAGQINLKATEAAKQEQAERNAQNCLSVAESLLSRLGVEGLSRISVESISKRLGDFAEVKSTDRTDLQSARDEARARIIHLEKEAEQLEGNLHAKRDDLDYDECERNLAEIERRRTICFCAAPILETARENILKAVLPTTLDYMRSILPSLTCGRYHDAKLDEESYKIRVWDNRAGDYIEKEIFSGATQDQFSLALRLAFALATLPQGLGAQPKFVFLDEPTAGFDGERREAFVRLLIDGEMSERFDQIFLATPEGIFNSNPLPHHIRINAGKIVSENLSSIV